MNVLVISGGGALGAFSAGVISNLVIDRGMNFDVIIGTSTGSIIAPLVATNDIPLMLDLYQNVTNNDILSKSMLGDFNVVINGYVNGITPLQNLIDKYFTEERYNKIKNSAKQVFVALTNLQTGKIEYGTKDDDFSTFKTKILASCCQPFFMPTIHIGNYDYVDGGVLQVLPVEKALSFNADKIVAISAFVAPENRIVKTDNFANKPLPLNMMLRIVDLFVHQNFDDSVKLGSSNPNFTLIQPPQEITADPLNFDPKIMQSWIDLGQEVAASYTI